MSKLIKIDDNYKNWIKDVSKRFKQSQIKAAIKVNADMLMFYWSLGRDISKMTVNVQYGNAFYKNVSDDLQEIFPDVHSFSATNLRYMKRFYELYSEIEILPQLGEDFENQKLPQLGEQPINAVFTFRGNIKRAVCLL